MLNDDLGDIPALVPIFPLPEVVMFPCAVLPLHIFEPRYREMTADALLRDGYIATALLQPGFEPHYYTRRAPIHRVISVGKIIASEELDDGNFNILLRGLARARIQREVPHESYRVGCIELIESHAISPCMEQQLRCELRHTVCRELVDVDVQKHWLQLFECSLNLGQLVDAIASTLPVDAELRQDLLNEADPAARAVALRDHLRTLAAVTQTRRSQCTAPQWGMN